MRRLFALVPFVVVVPFLFAADPPASKPTTPKPDADGYVPMFNGKDLSGWANVNCAKDTFFVKDGEVITTGRPTGFLRTAKQYENFELEMDWMHVNTKEVGNSGLFVWGDPLPAVGTGYTRGIEVQVLVNLNVKDTYTSHGDLFSIWGAHCKPDRPHPKGWERCLPSEERAKGGGEWNHYKVLAKDGVIKLEVNGKEVSGVSDCTPRKGYLALESEGAECHFKNIKIKELPSSNPKPEQVAKEDEGFVSALDGLTLDGWKTDKGAWTANDGVLKSNGKADLTLAAPPKRFELTFDWRGPAEARIDLGNTLGNVAGGMPVVEAVSGDKLGEPQKEWKRVRLTGEGGRLKFAAADKLELRNIFLREIKEKK